MNDKQRAALEKAKAWMTTQADTDAERLQQVRYAIWQIIDALQAQD